MASSGSRQFGDDESRRVRVHKSGVMNHAEVVGWEVGVRNWRRCIASQFCAKVVASHLGIGGCGRTSGLLLPSPNPVGLSANTEGSLRSREPLLEIVSKLL